MLITYYEKYCEDENQNRAYYAYFGSKDKASQSLQTLIDCAACINCISCKICIGCVDCVDCELCRNCWRCINCDTGHNFDMGIYKDDTVVSYNREIADDLWMAKGSPYIYSIKQEGFIKFK